MTALSTLLPTYATINLAALAHNLSRITHYLLPGCEAMAVVKANAYGHGAVETAGLGLDWKRANCGCDG